MDVTQFRKQKDEFFRSVDSPLTPEQRIAFTALNYFPENPSLRLRLPLNTDVAHETIIMQTSTGSQRRYTRAGKIDFTVDQQPATVFVYQDEHGYFIPFRDGTSGHESYAAGRYLEPEMGDDQQLIVDFNLAYNPYCAYNEHFSCPLPPPENWLKVRIEAGEQKFA